MASSPYDLFGPSPFARDPGLLLGGGGSPFGMPGMGMAPPPQVNFQAMANVFEPKAPVVKRSALDKLTPKSDLHKEVLGKLKAMFNYSEKAMQAHHGRWNYGEAKVQAYADGIQYGEYMDAYSSSGTPPEPFNIIVPYSYATIHAAATFIASVLLGRKPLFPLLGTRGTNVDSARYMELAIQTQLDYSQAYEKLWQHIWDSLIYGFGTVRPSWREVQGQVMKMILGPTGQMERNFSLGTTYAGNHLDAIDAYDFFPDPRVPLHEVHKRGEFVFNRLPIAETVLKDLALSGNFKYVDEALSGARGGNGRHMANTGQRRIRIGEDKDTRTDISAMSGRISGFFWGMEGTVRLSPKEWKLGEEERSELWKFAWLGDQIIQAEPLGYIHEQHPYLCSEPTSFGYDFMSLSFSDMIAPFQDIISWVVSSRMENVRAAVSNTFVADPAKVELNDLARGPIGRIIRLKQTAIGSDVRMAIQQLQVNDVTRGHITDLQTLRILADTITGVNDNMRGIQTAGGRRSATEARMSMQAGASRLSQLAVRISSQCLHPCVSQMILNTQQLIPDEFWIEQTGDDGRPLSTQLTPDMIVGSFNYMISDGSLPYDKQAMVEQWKEILFGVARDPELRQQYDIGKIFNYVAELGGANNIDSFKRQVPPMPPVLAGAAENPEAAVGGNPFAMGPAMPSAPI